MAVVRYTPHTFAIQPQKGSIYRRVATVSPALEPAMLERLNGQLPFDNFNPAFLLPTRRETVALAGSYRFTFDTSDFVLDPRAGPLLFSIEAVYIYVFEAAVLAPAPFVVQKVPPYSLESKATLRAEPQLYVLHSSNFLPVRQDFIDLTINGSVLRIFATLSLRV